MRRFADVWEDYLYPAVVWVLATAIVVLVIWIMWHMFLLGYQVKHDTFVQGCMQSGMDQLTCSRMADAKYGAP